MNVPVVASRYRGKD